MTASSGDTSRFLLLAALRIQQGESADAFYACFICFNLLQLMFTICVAKAVTYFSAAQWSQDWWEQSETLKTNPDKGLEN